VVYPLVQEDHPPQAVVYPLAHQAAPANTDSHNTAANHIHIIAEFLP